MPEPQGFVTRRHVSGLLSRTTRSITVGLGRRLGESGVSFAQYLVLVRLWRAAPRPLAQSQLVADLAVERSSMSTLLSSLEEDGLVRRTSDALDTRRLYVELTARGRSLEQPVLEAVDGYEAALVRSFSGEELGVLRDLLERLQDEAFELRSGADHADPGRRRLGSRAVATAGGQRVVAPGPVRPPAR